MTAQTPDLRGPLTALACALVMGACGSNASVDGEADVGKKGSAIRVKVLTLSPTDFDDRVEATGSLEADHDATLSARTSGTLEDLAPLGKQVRKGAVVARVDPGIPVSGVRQAEAALRSAKASLSLAKQRYDRQKPLYEQSVISALEFQSIQAEYEEAQAQLAQAEASLAQAQQALSDTRILAPFSGVVDAHFVDRGEQVVAGTQVLRVVDAKTLVVKAGLPERYAADIQPGAQVLVRLPAYGLDPRPGTVRFVATAIDKRSRTFDIEVALNNGDARLKPEMVATLVVTRARIEDALVVPQEAVLRDEDGLHIFVLDEGEEEPVARRRAIVTSGRGGGKVVVTGPSAGERVVVVGQTKLIDGDLIVVSEPPREGSPAKAERVP